MCDLMLSIKMPPATDWSHDLPLSHRLAAAESLSLGCQHSISPSIPLNVSLLSLCALCPLDSRKCTLARFFTGTSIKTKDGVHVWFQTTAKTTKTFSWKAWTAVFVLANTHAFFFTLILTNSHLGCHWLSRSRIGHYTCQLAVTGVI